MSDLYSRQLIYVLDRIATALEKIAGIDRKADENDNNT